VEVKLDWNGFVIRRGEGLTSKVGNFLQPNLPLLPRSLETPLRAHRRHLHFSIYTPLASRQFLAQIISSADKANHHASFGTDYTTTCLWYVRGLCSLGVEEERKDMRTGVIREKIGKRTLMIAGELNVVCPVERTRMGMDVGVEGGRMVGW